MPMFTATLGSFSGISFHSQLSTPDSSIPSSISFPIIVRQFNFSKYAHKLTAKMPWYHTTRVFVSGNTEVENSENGTIVDPDGTRQAQVCYRFSLPFWVCSILV
ncbi:hypothetical protein L6164_012062 [Bauhinia variegata]|uniref:Uncharacterized protein n=1 Tax=Bauhinia variegata TaxID=167791 RepID=A0ACB9P8X8_BAUVA|nr:hypothetical protein L6164_012062 [Bauhinia variegata]